MTDISLVFDGKTDEKGNITDMGSPDFNPNFCTGDVFVQEDGKDKVYCAFSVEGDRVIIDFSERVDISLNVLDCERYQKRIKEYFKDRGMTVVNAQSIGLPISQERLDAIQERKRFGE